MIKKIIVIFSVTLILYTQSSSASELLSDAKVLKVCFTGNFYPFESTKADGSLVGLDIDLMQDFSKKIGVQLKFIDMRWDGVIPALISNKCDLIAGGMTITPERLKVVAFSNTLVENKVAILANKTTLPNENSLEEVDKAGVVFAVKTATSAELYFTNHPPLHMQLLKFEDNAALISALLFGKVNAIAQDKTLLLTIFKDHERELRMLEKPIAYENIGVAIRKQDVELIAQFNSFLSEWKNGERYKKYSKEFF